MEADLWERVSADVADMQQGARRSSGRARGSGEGGLARAFVSDLSQFVDGRQVGEQQCVDSFGVYESSPGSRGYAVFEPKKGIPLTG